VCCVLCGMYLCVVCVCVCECVCASVCVNGKSLRIGEWLKIEQILHQIPKNPHIPKDYGIPIKIGGRPRKTMQDVINWYSKGPNSSIDRYRIHKTQHPQKYGISRIPSYNNNRNPLEKSYKSNNHTAGERLYLNGEPAVTYDGSQQEPSEIRELIKNLREKKYSIDEDKQKKEATEKQTTTTKHYTKTRQNKKKKRQQHNQKRVLNLH